MDSAVNGFFLMLSICVDPLNHAPPPLMQQHIIYLGPLMPAAQSVLQYERRKNKNPRLCSCCSGGSAAASALSRPPARSLGAGAAFQSSCSSKLKGLFRLARAGSTISIVKALLSPCMYVYGNNGLP